MGVRYVIPPVMPPSASEPEIEYPESDGKPMGDNTRQTNWIVMLIACLRHLFRARQHEVFVAGNLLWYPVEGDNQNCQAADMMVVFGRKQKDYRSYQQWKENGIAPQVVMELISPSNSQTEMAAKRKWYEQYGVLEYIEIDPEHHHAAVWQRDTADEQLLRVHDLAAWRSPHLGIRFVYEGFRLRLLGPNDELFVEPHEWRTQLDESRAETAAAAELAEQEKHRAETAESLAEQEAQRAEQEAQRAERLAAKLRELGVDPDEILSDD